MRFLGSLLVCGGLLVFDGVAAQLPVQGPAGAPSDPFIAHEIATGITGGYQVIAADINHDGKTDVIGLSQRGDLVW